MPIIALNQKEKPKFIEDDRVKPIRLTTVKEAAKQFPDLASAKEAVDFVLNPSFGFTRIRILGRESNV